MRRSFTRGDLRPLGSDHSLLSFALGDSVSGVAQCWQRGGTVMPKLVATHEVDDVAHWLASPKREEVFAGVATNFTTFVHPSEPNRVALSMDVADMDAFDKLMKSEAAAAAMKYDGVRPQTLAVYVEG
jgi:hypothetical protein